MSGALEFDEQTSRRVEAVCLTPDVVAQRWQVLKALELAAGERVLDIGSGPGCWPTRWRSLPHSRPYCPPRAD